MLKYLVSLGLACGFAMALSLGMAAEPDGPPVSAGSQGRLARAETLLDAWGGEGDGLQDAKADLDRVLRDDPKSANAYRLYARFYLIDGHKFSEEFEPGTLEAAMGSLGKSLEIAPDYARAYVLQGHVFRLMGKPVQAGEALRKAEQLGTSDPWLHLNKAELLMDGNRQDEAFVHYKRVLADNASPRTNSAAQSGLIRYYKRTKRLDEADALYRSIIASDPGSAWSHGNYASFLLCWRDDADAAVVEAVKARQLMDYGIARLTHGAALYRQWASLALDGNKESAKPLAAARALVPHGPAAAIDEVCGGGVAVLPVLEAVLLTAEGGRIPAKVAAVLAAEASGDKAGVFELQVRASGRDRGRLYLNSEADYRDARNLSVVFTSQVEAEFKRLHGSTPDEFLKGKNIAVLGSARQVKIFLSATM